MGKDTSTRSAQLCMPCITERMTYMRILSLCLSVDDANIGYTAEKSWNKCWMTLRFREAMLHFTWMHAISYTSSRDNLVTVRTERPVDNNLIGPNSPL